MMGRQTGDQSQLFYLFNLEERIPGPICGRRINPVVTRVLGSAQSRAGPMRTPAAFTARPRTRSTGRRGAKINAVSAFITGKHTASGGASPPLLFSGAMELGRAI